MNAKAAWIQMEIAEIKRERIRLIGKKSQWLVVALEQHVLMLIPD